MELSSEAKTALINVGTNRQGAVVHPNLPAGTLSELRRKALIGEYGLTMAGSIARARIVAERLDAAF